LTRADDVMHRLQTALAQLEKIERRDPILQACIAGVGRLEALLARRPRVVILGEVNAGKTSLADLLLGARVLPASVVANTQMPVVIRHAERMTVDAVTVEGRVSLLDNDDAPFNGASIERLEIGLPNARLKEFEIVDTPAASATETADVTGDIRIWCTVATRAWTESERMKWSTLPRHVRRNALLVATHKDALEHPGDADKIEWRLRSTAGDMFRDVSLVSAADAASRGPSGMPSDAGAAAFVIQVRTLAFEIQERRALKVDRLARRLARLTLHHLLRAGLRSAEARILQDWEIDCARLLARLDEPASGELIPVLEQLLRRFAQAMHEVMPDYIGQHGRWSPSPSRDPARPATSGPSAKRYARLVAADLSSLLRMSLARSGLRDEGLYASYYAAQRALLPLARMDETIDELGSLLVPRATNEARPGTDKRASNSGSLQARLSVASMML
jgi:hypothetical protein